MKEFLTILLAFVVIVGGAAGVYFLLTKYFAKEDAPKKSAKVSESNKARAAAEKKAAEAEKKAAAEKAAAEKRKAEMMKKVTVQADPKVLKHRLILKAEEEITKIPQSVEKIVVKANRIDWTMKEEFAEYSGNIFFDDPDLHRLDSAEMKLVAEHFFGLVKKHGFEMEEKGSGEKGTHRYHVDEYVITAL